MAEVPKFNPTPVYNQPIGVVQPMRDTSGETLQRVGQQIFDHDYAKVYAAEEAKGKAYGAAARFGKSKDNKVMPVEIPETFSKVARSNAAPVADKRYVNRLTLDAQKHASILHANAEKNKDHKGFQANWNEYSKATIARLASNPELAKYAAPIAAALDAEGFSHGKKLYADRLALEHKQAFTDSIQIIETVTGDLRTQVSLDAESFDDGGLSVFDSDDLREMYLKQIDDLEKDFPTLAERAAQQTLKDNVNKEYFLGKLDTVASKLIQNIGDNYNVYTSDIPIGNVMKSAQTAIRTGNMDNIKNARHREILENAGLGKIIATSGFGNVQDKLAASFDSVENNIVAQAKDSKNSLMYSAYAGMLSNNIPLSANGSAHVLKTGRYAIGTEQELLNALPIILNGSRDDPEYKVLMGNGPLPPFVTNAMTPDSIDAYIAQNGMTALIPLRNYFKQATHRMRDGRMDINQRGFSDDTFMFFETMDAISNTVLFKDFTPADLMNKKAEMGRDSKLANETVNTLIAGHMSMDGKQATVLDFVRESTESTDVGVNNHFARYAPELIYTFGAARAANIIANSVEKVFKKSDYMFMQGGQKTFTRMAPEQHFRGEGEMDIILSSANNKLKLSGKGKNLVIGQTAFFAPTTGSRPVKSSSGKLIPTGLPSYRIVDRNGQVLLDANSQPLVVGPQTVYQDRGLKSTAQIEAELAKGKAARAKFLSSTNSLGQKNIQPLGASGSAAANKSLLSSVNKTLDAQRKRARQLAGQP